MKKKQNIILGIFESLFYSALTAAIISGKADQWIGLIPFFGFALAGVALALLIAVILTMNKPYSPYQRFRSLLGISLLSIAAVHGTSQAGASFSVYPASPVYFLYFAVIISYAVMGNGLRMGIAVSLCIAGEGANCVMQGYFGTIRPSQIGLLGAGMPDTWIKPALNFIAMIFSGILPYFISILKRPAAPERKLTMVRQGSAAPAEPPSALSDHLPASSLHSGKTSLLLTRQDGDIHEEQSEIDDILSSVVYFMSRNFKAYSALGFVYEADAGALTLNSFHSKSMTIIKNIRIPLGRGVVGRVGAEKTAFMTGDLLSYNTELNYYSGISPVKSILATPVISETKELLGALVIDSLDNNAFKDEHKEILRRFSSLAAALITSARMRHFQERTARQFQIFYEASQQFITAMRAEQVFAVLVSIAQQIAVYTRIIAVSFNEADSVCTVVKIRGPSADLPEGFSFPLNAGLYSYALQKQKIVNVPDFREFRGKYYRFTPEEPGSESIRSLIVLPIMGEASRPLGLLSVEHTEPNGYGKDMETILFTLVGNALVAFTRARLYQKMELLAITDGLTQLINHKHFQGQLAKEMERSRRYKRSMSLLILDIDHFKSFNDTYGHQVGDLVLREIAQCVKSALRTNDQAARYGGEEFAVIIPETSEQGALTTAERIRAKIESRVIQSGKDQLRVTISIGCATYPVHAADQRELIANADTALYHAKESGRNQSCLYVKGMTAHDGK